jgi:phage N-6-adenine-methyltransferase
VKPLEDSAVAAAQAHHPRAGGDDHTTGASFRRGASKQDYRTPRDLLEAVEARFGAIAWDLAASADNAVADRWIGEEQNSLTVAWNGLSPGRLLWCNPPFGQLAPWASKAAREADLGARIALLVPAGVGSRWFGEYVLHRALVLALVPRPSFDGKHSYPKDILLAVYGEPRTFEQWRWRAAG